MKKIIRRSVYIGVFVCLSLAITSCEEDFTDIGSNVISNIRFSTNSESIYVTAENSATQLEKIQSDNISRQLGQYLLGIYNRPDYEKLEASIVSQIAISPGLKVVDATYGTDTTVVTKIDTVFLKLPYQVTLNTEGTAYDLDSIIGNQNDSFNFNLYRSNTFINLYNPTDPTKINSLFSNDVFDSVPFNKLNDKYNFPFKPDATDTSLVITRRLSNDAVATKDTLKLFISAASTIPIPFARVALNKDRFKELFLDKYESSEFASQDAFNDYFRGVILEATGTEGSLISFNFNNNNTSLNPSIEVYYTNTVLKSGTTILDTISKNNSFPLSGFRVNTYKMEEKTYPVNDEIKIQGTAGSEADITLFDQNKIDELRAKNWLINDASLTFYINKDVDTNYVPNRLYLYKKNNFANTNFSQIKDATSEASFGGIAGNLERSSDGKVEKYTFKITDYISDILSGETNYSPTLKLKVFNPSDLPVTTSDTIFRNYSWNAKAVTLFNNRAANTSEKAVLKISYSEKK